MNRIDKTRLCQNTKFEEEHLVTTKEVELYNYTIYLLNQTTTDNPYYSTASILHEANKFHDNLIHLPYTMEELRLNIDLTEYDVDIEAINEYQDISQETIIEYIEENTDSVYNTIKTVSIRVPENPPIYDFHTDSKLCLDDHKIDSNVLNMYCSFYTDRTELIHIKKDILRYILQDKIDWGERKQFYNNKVTTIIEEFNL